jgi:hypothetical protein
LGEYAQWLVRSMQIARIAADCPVQIAEEVLVIADGPAPR